MDAQVATIITAVIAGVCGSGVTGLIQFLITRHDKKEDDSKEKLDVLLKKVQQTQNAVLGLDHDRLFYLCQKYIEKQEITKEEYENLYKYIYKPYTEMGGNGTGERLMKEVSNLHIKN